MPWLERRGSALWYVLALLAVANFLNYTNRNVVLTMYGDFRQVFHFDHGQLGLLMTVFMVAHAPATLFFGWLSDRVARKKVLAIGVLTWSGASLLTAFAEGSVSILTLRAIVGFGTAACVPVANAMICDCVHADHKARAVSVFNLGLFLGGAAATVIGSVLGFPSAFLLAGIPGIAIAGLILSLRLVPIAPDTQLMSAALPNRVSERSLSTRSAVLALLRKASYRWTVLGAALMAFSAGGYLAWFFEFFQEEKGASENEALLIVGISLITGLGGVLTGGIVADRMMRSIPHGRQATVALGIALSVPLALAVLYLPLGPWFYLSSGLLMFTISWYHGPIATSVDEMVPRQDAGLAQGFYIATMHLTGTAPASFLVGWLGEIYGLQTALLLPTATMVLAAFSFTASFGGVKRAAMVQEPRVIDD